MNPAIYGLMAEFNSAEELLHAARRVYAEGFRDMDAFTPFPVDGLAKALGKKKSIVSLLVLLGGIAGCTTGFFMQWFASVIHYPLNSGGRPLNSWPAFIPITFELTVLCAGFTALFALIFLNRHPQLHHPVFNSLRFTRASVDKFFLCIEVTDPQFDRERTTILLRSLGAQDVSELPL